MKRVHWNEHRKREDLTLAGEPFRVIEAQDASPVCDWDKSRPAENERPGGQFSGQSGPPPALVLCDRCAATYDLAAVLLKAGIITAGDVAAFTQIAGK